MISIHLVPSQNNIIFYNNYIKCIEQGVFRIERKTFSRHYVLNVEKCETVFKLLASTLNTMLNNIYVKHISYSTYIYFLYHGGIVCVH